MTSSRFVVQSIPQHLIQTGLFQIMENKEINELVKIIGLQYKKKYLNTEDLRTLRYGRVMIMTDQDQVTLMLDPQAPIEKPTKQQALLDT